MTHTFVVRNEGTGPLRIEGVELRSPGMKTRFKSVIPPGESGHITLECDTSSLDGPSEAAATVRLSDADRPKVELVLSGTVIRAVDILPMPAVYFSVYKGETATRSVTIVNRETTPLEIRSVEPAGEHFVATIAPVTEGKTVQARRPCTRRRDARTIHGVGVFEYQSPDGQAAPRGGERPREERPLRQSGGGELRRHLVERARRCGRAGPAADAETDSQETDRGVLDQIRDIERAWRGGCGFFGGTRQRVPNRRHHRPGTPDTGAAQRHNQSRDRRQGVSGPQRSCEWGLRSAIMDR